jgi:hypothetical protein
LNSKKPYKEWDVFQQINKPAINWQDFAGPSTVSPCFQFFFSWNMNGSYWFIPSGVIKGLGHQTGPVVRCRDFINGGLKKRHFLFKNRGFHQQYFYRPYIFKGYFLGFIHGDMISIFWCLGLLST